MLKIGWTRKHPSVRANDLHTSGLPTPFNVEFVIKTPNGSTLEKIIHEHFKKYRVNSNREFFKISKDELTEILTKELTLELTPLTDIITPINKKTSHGKPYNEIKTQYDILKKEADEFFTKLKNEGHFANASRTLWSEYHMITQELAYFEKTIGYLLNNYEQIKNEIGVEQIRKDNKAIKKMILETHKRLNDLKL